MFLETSRYALVPQITAVTSTGRPVRAIRLRRLPTPRGIPHTVQEQDRLDILAHRQYNNSAGFWQIADANTELAANGLVAEPLRVIQI